MDIFETLQVHIRFMLKVYLLLGSNLGDRKAFLEKATAEIALRIGAISQKSAYYETASWGNTLQPAFINQALAVNTRLSANNLLVEVLSIEKKLGRTRDVKWGSRVIDIDILFYGDDIITAPDLIVPHPLFAERRFAVEPMLELAPDYVHPQLKKTIKSIALELTDNLCVQKT